MKHKNVILIEFGNLKDIFTQKNRVIFRPRWLDNGSKKAAEIIYLIALPKNSNSEKSLKVLISYEISNMRFNFISF